MNSQLPVEALSPKQQLAKLEQSDATHQEDVGRFSGKNVKVALLTSLPFVLAGLLTLLTSFFLPLGLVFGLATASYFAAGTIASTAIYKALSDRKAKAMPADSVLPYINQNIKRLENTFGDSSGPASSRQIYGSPAVNKAQQKSSKPFLPEPGPDASAASGHKALSDQSLNPSIGGVLPDNPGSRLNTDNSLQNPASVRNTPGTPDQNYLRPEPSLRGRTLPPKASKGNTTHLAANTPTQNGKTHASGNAKPIISRQRTEDEASTEALTNALFVYLRDQNTLNRTAPTSLEVDSAYDGSTSSLQSNKSLSSDYNSMSSRGSPLQSEPEDDNPDAALDCSVNTSKARKHNQPDNSSSSLPAVKAARKEPSTTSANRAENSPATVPILFQRDQPGLSSDAGFDDESDSSFFNTIEREESKVSEVPKTPEDSLVDGDPLEEGRPTEDVLPAPINDSSSIGKQIVPINQALPVAKQAHIVSEASEEVEDDSQTAKQQTAKCAVSVSPQTELPLPKTATAFDPGSISQQADTSSPLQSQKKITPGQSKRPATKKTQPESITRASASLSDLSLKAKTHENTKTRKNEKLTFQKQTENKTAPAIEGKEDKAPIQSTDTHTRSTSYKSAEKRVSASVSDNLTGLSEKSVTECRTSTSLVRSSAKQVVTTHGNDTTGLRLFSDGKALYFNGELKDSGGKLQLRLTPANTGRSISDNTGLDSIKQPDCVIKIEEDLMRPATSEHSSSALAIPADANTHHHLKVSLLFNWDVPSTATVITINRQATHDDLANLQYCLNNHGTCDLGIDKSQLPALQLDKWFALESGRALGELEKAIEIDTAENLVVTVTDSAQFSIAPAPTKTPVEDVLSCSPPEQPEKDLSLANLNTPASVEEADKTRVPVSKQYPDGNYVPVEKILSVSTHPMMRQQATTDRQRQASGTEEIIHGMLGNFKETRGNSQPISMQAHEGKISGSSILGIKEPAQEMLKTLLPVTPEYPISVLAPRENGPLPDKELPSARTQPVAAQQANENKSQPEKTTAPSSTFTANAFNLAEKTAPLITASEAFDSGTNHSEGKDRDEDQDHPLSGRQTSETEEVISEGHTANTPALVASKAEPKELPTGKTIRAQKSKKTTGWGKLSLNNFSNIFARSEKKHPEPRQTAATSKDESLELVSVISEGLLKQYYEGSKLLSSEEGALSERVPEHMPIQYYLSKEKTDLSKPTLTHEKLKDQVARDADGLFLDIRLKQNDDSNSTEQISYRNLSDFPGTTRDAQAKQLVERLLGKLDAFLASGGVHDDSRRRHLRDVMLDYSHQGAFAIHCATGSFIADIYIDNLKSQLNAHIGPIMLYTSDELITISPAREVQNAAYTIRPAGGQKCTHVEFQIDKDKQSLLIRKVYACPFGLIKHSTDSMVSDSPKRISIETHSRLGLRPDTQNKVERMTATELTDSDKASTQQNPEPVVLFDGGCQLCQDRIPDF